MENKGEIPGMNKMKGYAKGGDTKSKKKRTDKKERTRGQDFGAGGSGASRAYATSRMRDPETMAAARDRDRFGEELLPVEIIGENISPRPTPRPSRGMESSPRPTTRPANLAKRKGMAKGGMVGYAEGGMVKSTGKMNTGIKKCGE
jgi:hypothetical protein